MKPISEKDLRSIIDQFHTEGKISEIIPWGNGLINDTYKICTAEGPAYLMQRMNEANYPDLDGLMHNIYRVTEKIAEQTFYFLKDGSPKQELRLIPLRNGDIYYRHPDLGCWRMYNFMSGTYSIEKADARVDILKTGVILGQFHYLLRDFPVEDMVVTVPDFHNPKEHYKKLLRAVSENKLGRACEIQEELAFFESMKDNYDLLNDAYAQGLLPLRVNHNDPKINNIMFDERTDEPICMVDLDTMMPGLIAYDFGDAIRSCMCTGKDYPDMTFDKPVFDRHLYHFYLTGFIEGTQGMLTASEMWSLPIGARLIALESGIRYLTDYLNGDVYLKTRYPKQNLVKCRLHIKLARDIMDFLE